tara:strand:+ start:34353 stop:34517 length:165 start_codon:yes stop_codon:yes gene_type:complete
MVINGKVLVEKFIIKAANFAHKQPWLSALIFGGAIVTVVYGVVLIGVGMQYGNG